MIYHPKNKTKGSFTKIVILFFVVVLVLRFFNNSLIIQVFNYPVHYILDSTHTILKPFKHSLLYFKDRDDLQNRIIELEKQNLELSLNQIVQQSNTQEFDYFINNFGVATNTSELFRVISRSPFMAFDFIRITGNLQQYTVDDFVFYKSILIGKIIEKNNTYATVQLFSSPDQKTLISVKGAQFEAKGLGGGRYLFEVGKDFDIQEKDIILFAGKDMYIMGVVELIESNESDLFKKVYFNTPVSISELSYVSVGNNQIYEQHSNSN